MKIVRFINDTDETRYGVLQADETVTYLTGCPFDGPSDTGERATVVKTLAPLKPKSIVCIGLNYRKHAEEGGADMPEHPVVFMKMPSTVQNPGDPIEIPRIMHISIIAIKSSRTEGELMHIQFPKKNCSRILKSLGYGAIVRRHKAIIDF